MIYVLLYPVKEQDGTKELISGKLGFVLILRSTSVKGMSFGKSSGTEGLMVQSDGPFISFVASRVMPYFLGKTFS